MSEMTMEFFVPLLAMFTLGALLLAAIRGEKRVKELKEDPEVRRSALSEDGDPHRPQTDETIRKTKAA